jgi:endo-1,4-beta-xylanase
MKNNMKKQSKSLCVVGIILLITGLSMTTCKSTGGSREMSDSDNSKSGSMPLTNLYEVALCVEGYNINGSASITENILSVNGTPISSYDWEYWKDSGNGSLTIGDEEYDYNGTGTNDNGTFSCDWVAAGGKNFLARAGKKWHASNLTHSQIGDISVKYTADPYSPNGNGVSYLCVYGWMRDSTRDPSLLIEYYIVDSWADTRPPGSGANARRYGSINVDGGTYDIYVSTRTNQPSINGTQTFQQYWSIRKAKRTSGTISVSEHFKKWESIK